MVGAVIATLSRFKNADFPSSWISNPFSILIPIPKSSTTIGALIEPMSTEVYIIPIKNSSIRMKKINFMKRRYFHLITGVL